MAQLTQEELQAIQDLQVKYNQTVFDLGSVEAQVIAINQRLKNLTNDKDGLVADLISIEKKENELIASYTEKYGQGTINPQTGEITPI
jgi:hypothetical protein